MKKVLFGLLFVALFSCNKKEDASQKQTEIVEKKETKKEVKKETEHLQIEDIITSVTKENMDLLIKELEAKHKHNDFVTIETDKEPITIVFEDIKGKMTYTGIQYEYDEHNEKKENAFTTLTNEQLKKLKETGRSGWKD